MTPNTENIEALLCAYIEGDLDDAARAQIEQHLAAHPQHRKLIAELTQTRDMVRGLPRADAPREIAETLLGHLERSVLLGDTPSPLSLTKAPANRRAQVFALAAAILLTIGLGAVVYVVLMPTFEHPRYAESPPLPSDTAPNAQAQSLAERTNRSTDVPEPPGIAGKMLSPVAADVSRDRQETPIVANADAPVVASAAVKSDVAALAPNAGPGAPNGTNGATSANGEIVASATPVSPTAGLIVPPSAPPAAPSAMPTAAAAAPPVPQEQSIAAVAPASMPAGEVALADDSQRSLAAQLVEQLHPLGQPRQPVVVVMTAADSVSANAQVAQYLGDNSVQWTASLPDETYRTLATSRPAIVMTQFTLPPPAAALAQAQRAPFLPTQNTVSQSDQLAAQTASAQAAGNPGAASVAETPMQFVTITGTAGRAGGRGGRGGRGGGAAIGGAGGGAVAGAGAGADGSAGGFAGGAVAGGGGGRAAGVGGGGRRGGGAPVANSDSAAILTLARAQSPGTNSVYVARNLTRPQVEAIQNLLATSGAVTGRTYGLDGPIQKSLNAAAPSQSAPLEAARQLADDSAAATRPAIGAATFDGRLAANAPATTAPTAEAGALGIQPTTQPSFAPADNLAARRSVSATASSALDAMSNERLDLVIVIQSTPSTQPAAGQSPAAAPPAP
jgi:hypothetical protein